MTQPAVTSAPECPESAFRVKNYSMNPSTLYNLSMHTVILEKINFLRHSFVSTILVTPILCMPQLPFVTAPPSEYTIVNIDWNNYLPSTSTAPEWQFFSPLLQEN
jgi:hypothetical protein